MGCGASKTPVVEEAAKPAKQEAAEAKPEPAVSPPAEPGSAAEPSKPAPATPAKAAPATKAPAPATPAPSKAAAASALTTPTSTYTPPAAPAANGGAVIFVLGNEACGKEDICSKVAAEVGGSYLSATELLRMAVESGSEEGNKLAEMIKQGKIVPAAMTTSLLTGAMATLPPPYLVDGFPKSLDNLSTFESEVGACKLGLYLELSDEHSKAVMLEQGKEEELIQRKLRNFTTQTLPIAQALEGRELLKRVPAADRESAFQAALAAVRGLSGGAPGAAAASSAAVAAPAPAAAKAAIVFVLGGPGAGKTVQCGKLMEKYGGSYFAAGDLLRDEVKKGSEHGRVIAEMIKEGKIVPTQVTIDLFKMAMESNPGPYLIEGFPRSVDNLVSFEEQCGACSALIFLDVSDELMQERCLARAKEGGNATDSADTIARRARTFKNQSMPVVEELQGRGLLLKVDGSGDEAAVSALVAKAFEPYAKR